MVNIFVIDPNIYKTMEVLDYRRLGKQRLEAKQIINTLESSSDGWKNHPALLSWKDHIEPLKAYYNICVQEWVNRGYKNTMELYEIDESKFHALEYHDGKFSEPDKYSYPKFVSFEPFIFSHQASLKRKDSIFYKDLIPPEEYLSRGYLWPCKYSDEIYENWNLNYLDPLGCGVPAEYRISEEEVKKWELNKLINPKTGRKIKESGSIYKDLQKASLKYKEM